MSKTFIEFFSGSGVLSETFKNAGYDVLTIDINAKLNPSLVADVLFISSMDLPLKFRNPDVVFFGVPCTDFSIAGNQNNFTNFMPNTVRACISLGLVYKCLNLIDELKPSSWFIENPMGYLRKFPFMQLLIKKEVWYCQYGDIRAKPTDIFTNRGDWISKKCFNNNPLCNHERVPRSSKNTGTQGLNNAFLRGMYPPGLCKELVLLCENKLKEKQSRL